MEIKNGMAVLSHNELKRLYALASIGHQHIKESDGAIGRDRYTESLDGAILVEAYRFLDAW